MGPWNQCSLASSVSRALGGSSLDGVSGCCAGAALIGHDEVVAAEVELDGAGLVCGGR